MSCTGFGQQHIRSRCSEGLLGLTESESRTVRKRRDPATNGLRTGPKERGVKSNKSQFHSGSSENLVKWRGAGRRCVARNRHKYKDCGLAGQAGASKRSNVPLGLTNQNVAWKLGDVWMVRLF